MQTTSSVQDSSGSRERPTVSTIANEIRQEKGILGFWSGYSATLILTLNPSLTFLFFENLKLLLISKPKRSNPPPLATFLIAALSKALASTITYPFSLAKARTQASRNVPLPSDSSLSEKSSFNSSKRRTNAALQRTIIGTLLEIIHNEGISALYRGLEGEVLKGFFSHGITMLLKDAVHGLIVKLYFAVLRLAKRYPSPDELKRLAIERASSATTYAREIADSLSEKTVSATETLNQRGAEVIAGSRKRSKEAATFIAEQSKSAVEYVSEQGKTTAEYVSKQSQTAVDFIGEKGENLVSDVQDLAGKVKETIVDQAAGIDEFVREYIGDDWDED